MHVLRRQGANTQFYADKLGLVKAQADTIGRDCCVQVEKDYLENPNFTPDSIKTKSGAAAGLCSWVINVCKYFRIYQVTSHVIP